jgi:hypothetical protein
MNERAEYFAILAALCVSDETINPKCVAEFAYSVWAAGNRIANEAGMKKEVK